MVEAKPQTFALSEQDSSICLKRVTLRRSFEADKSGKTTIHVWIEAEATPAAEAFETIEGNVEFVLYNGENRIGSCAARELKFTDDGLRIETHEDVTHVEADVEAAILTRSTSKLKLERD